MGISTVVDPLGDCLRDGLEDLAVSPVIAPLAQCLRAVLRMCLRVPVLGRRGHAGVSGLPHMNRLDWLGRTS